MSLLGSANPWIAGGRSVWLGAEYRSALSLGQGPVGWAVGTGHASAVFQAKTMVLLVACPF